MHDRPAERRDVTPELTNVPAQMILGTDGPDRNFDLICWNEANSLAEEMTRPYCAALRVSRMAIWQPADRFALVTPMTELRIRYEDEPERRVDVAAEIVAVLGDFRVAAPWPLLTAG